MTDFTDISIERRKGHLTFNIGAVVLIVTNVLLLVAQWYNTKASIQSLQDYQVNVVAPAISKISDLDGRVASLSSGMTILLNRQGYDGSKIVQSPNMSIAPVINSQ